MSDEFTADFPAFPVAAGHEVYCSGMNLRDYMAAQFLCGFCSDPDMIYERKEADGSIKNYMQQYAKLSYDMADAMLQEGYGNDME